MYLLALLAVAAVFASYSDDSDTSSSDEDDETTLERRQIFQTAAQYHSASRKPFMEQTFMGKTVHLENLRPTMSVMIDSKPVQLVFDTGVHGLYYGASPHVLSHVEIAHYGPVGPVFLSPAPACFEGVAGFGPASILTHRIGGVFTVVPSQRAAQLEWNDVLSRPGTETVLPFESLSKQADLSLDDIMEMGGIDQTWVGHDMVAGDTGKSGEKSEGIDSLVSALEDWSEVVDTNVFYEEDDHPPKYKVTRFAASRETQPFFPGRVLIGPGNVWSACRPIVVGPVDNHGLTHELPSMLVTDVSKGDWRVLGYVGFETSTWFSLRTGALDLYVTDRMMAYLKSTALIRGMRINEETMEIENCLDNARNMFGSPNWTRLPTFTFYLGAKLSVLIPPEEYVVRAEGRCQLQLRASPLKDAVILGWPILRKFVTQFDYTTKRVRMCLV